MALETTVPCAPLSTLLKKATRLGGFLFGVGEIVKSLDPAANSHTQSKRKPEAGASSMIGSSASLLNARRFAILGSDPTTGEIDGIRMRPERTAFNQGLSCLQQVPDEIQAGCTFTSREFKYLLSENPTGLSSTSYEIGALPVLSP